jgi:hypothetical protein
MGLSLQELLPNLSGGLSNTGFMFGAGTSVEAGYPMMAQLTREVIQALHISDRAALDEVLQANAIVYDHGTGSPNVEVVADLVMAHALSTGASRFTQLESRLRDLVTDVILGVASPTLDNHVDFLMALRQRAFGRPSCIHIFTTNYDVLFELAGAEAGVVIETGFVGSVERFFDHQRFAMSCGVVQSQSRFSEHAALTVRLIKLHGSVSWITRGGNVFERHPASIAPADKRVMILPRRRKVMDTLQPPHDALFTVASRALGAECKYVAACGFSFSDDHINANLLGPAVSTGKIKLFALCEAETPGIGALRSLPAFSAAFSTGGLRSGVPHSEGTDCWKFSRFVELFK